MEISEFSKGSIWSILPDHFDLLSQKFFEYQFNIENNLIEDYRAQTTDEDPKQSLYRVENEIAYISINGPLTKRESLFSFLFGGTTYQRISKQIKAAIEDMDARAIVLNIDSPGGVVTGVDAVGDLIYNGRGEKPIVAFSDGMMTSAAYWLGSAAEVLIAEKTAMIGSIGVLRIHVDYSEQEKKEGIKTTYLTAGKYKALGNDSEPLSNEAKDVFQAELDYIYSIFVDTVARNRDVEIEKVLTDMADGKVFFGNQALDSGLIDNVGNYRMAAGLAASMIQNRKIYLVRGQKMEISTVEQLIEAFPELVSQIQETAANKASKTARNEAQKAERKNLVDLLRIQFGEETAEQFQKIINSNVTADQFKAIKALEPESAAADPEDTIEGDARKTALESIQNAGAENPGADGEAGDQKDYMALVREYQALNKCDMLTAQRAIDIQYPGLRKSWIKKVNAK